MFEIVGFDGSGGDLLINKNNNVRYVFIPISVKSFYAIADQDKNPKQIKAEAEEREDFAQIVDLVNTHFSSSVCYIVIADSLHRHTEQMKGVVDASDALDRSLLAGRNWKEKNEAGYSRLIMDYEVIHWDTYLQLGEYDRAFTDITHEYDKKTGFFSSVNQVVLKFIQGFVSAQEKEVGLAQIQLDFQAASDLYRAYFLEELAVFKLWHDQSRPLASSGESVKSIVLYSFGNSSVNKTILNCFQRLCNDNFQLLNLVKTASVATKKNAKKNQKKTQHVVTDLPDSGADSGAESGVESSVFEQEKRMLSVLASGVGEQLAAYLRVSRLTVEQQIAFLHCVIDNCSNSLNEQPVSKQHADLTERKDFLGSSAVVFKNSEIRNTSESSSDLALV